MNQLPAGIVDQLESLCRAFARDPRTAVISDAVVAALRGAPLREIQDHYARLFASPERLEIIDHGLYRHGLSEAEMHTGTRREVVVGEHAALSSTSPLFQALLYHLARGRKPAVAVEFGTCVGLSTAVLAAAMAPQEARRLVTVEAARALHDLAVRNLHQLGHDWVDARCGLFEDVLPSIAGDLQGAEIGLVFDDGQHTGAAEQQRFDYLLPLCEEGAVVIFDDIHQNESMSACWRTVRDDPHVVGSADLVRMGICVVSRTGRTGDAVHGDLVVDPQLGARLQQALAAD